MLTLSRKTLHEIPLAGNIEVPEENIFFLPEKVIQFGSGGLLRALPDYFIDRANKAGIFNGRIVVVQSTSSLGEKIFGDQDCLYTLILRGIENNRIAEKKIVNASISRVFSALANWSEVIKCAANRDLKIILSNTTESGIDLRLENIEEKPPKSFPAKLTAFLFERFTHFGGSYESGMIIIPTELIVDNGTRLKEIVLKISEHNQLGIRFIQWLTEANVFCNSLVDRIVPGRPSEDERSIVEREMGYSDDLLTTAETYGLWAIESTDHRVHEVLGFATVGNGITIEPQIEKYRELKLRILNGGHSFCCGLALLLGIRTVKEALQDQHMGFYIRRLLLTEAVGSLDNDHISPEKATEFARQVVNRFENPFVDHLWVSIANNYISKVVIRIIPMLLAHYKKYSTPPSDMIFGFSSFLYYVNTSRSADYGNAPLLDEVFDITKLPGQLSLIFSDLELWKVDLNILPGFRNDVQVLIESFISEGVQETFWMYLSKTRNYLSN